MSDLQYCEKCDAYKTHDEFNKNKDGTHYSDCRLCHRKQSAVFWLDKKFKECLACGIMLPIRKYEKQDGVPFATCTKCYEARVAEEARQRKCDNALKKAAANVPTIPIPTPKSTTLPVVRKSVQRSEDSVPSTSTFKKAKFRSDKV